MKKITKTIGRFMPSKSWMGIIAGLTMSLSAVAQTPSDEVIIVPYRQASPSLPHVAHRNAPITLKAIVRNCSSSGTYTIAWDENRNGNFDDDYSFTVARNGTTLSIPDIGRSITAPDVTGDPVLTYNVRVRVPGGTDQFGAFKVKVHDFIPSNDPRNWTATQVDIMREMAVQEYLWFLHRNVYVGGVFGNHTSANMFGFLPGDNNGNLATPAALSLFTSNGRLPAYPPGTYTGQAPADFAQKNNDRWNNDPYAETSMRMLNRMLNLLSNASFGGGEEDNTIGYNPDFSVIRANRIAGTVNNQGLYANTSIHDAGPVGASGHILQSIASTLPALAGTVAVIGQNGTVLGRPMEYICQEMVDWLGFAQIDSGQPVGSWYFTPNGSTSVATWDASGYAITGLMSAEKYGRDYGVIVNNRHKYRIANALLIQQKGDGAMGRFSQAPASSFQHTGYAFAAARWLGFHDFPNDGARPFPADSSYTRAHMRQAYDRYLAFTAANWTAANRTDGYWADGLWRLGDYLVGNTSTAYNAAADGNAYALNTHSFAYTTGTNELTTIGPRDWRREFSIYGIRAQSRFSTGPRDGNYGIFGRSVQNYCSPHSYGCAYSAPFWASAMLAQSLTVYTVEPTAPEVEDQTMAINENSSNGALVGTVIATGGTGSLTYSITNGNTDGAFSIDSSTGEITVADSAALDFETLTSFELTIEVTDSSDPAQTATATVTINVNNVNEAPSGADKSVITLQDAPYTFTAVDFGFTDVDVPANNFVGIRITTLPAAGSLAVDGEPITAGSTVVLAGGYPVFTPAASASGAPYASFTFQVQDDGGTANGGVDLDPAPRTMTINVTALNSPATDIILSNASIAENEPVGAGVGSLSAEDPDAGNTHTFTLVEGDGDIDNASFGINGNLLETAAVFDYETKSSYSIRVRTTDEGGLFFEKQFTIGIDNVIEPIVITGQPESQTLAVGANAALSVTASGDSPQYQWRKDGDAIDGATDASLAIVDFQTENAARYDVVVSNGSGSVTSESAWLFASGAEGGSPYVTITSPESNERITNSLNVVVTGTTKDNGLGVAQVLYSVNGGDFTLADGTTDWTASVSVNPGLNQIQVKAVDLAANESRVVNRKFYAAIFSELTVTNSGLGTVIGRLSSFGTPTNGALLEIGRPYTIIAVPEGSNLFSNWTGSVTSDSATLKFTMESNMVLNANFVTNSFITVGGAYNGLFSDASGVEFKSSGFARFRVTPKQRLSGRLFVDGDAISVSGKMNIDGTISVTTRSRNRKTDKPELTLDLALGFANASGTLTGTISQEGQDGWEADLLAHRVVWSKTNILEQATNYINGYTMIVTNGTEGPVGSGFGFARVDKVGRTSLRGYAADGAPLKQAAIISKDGHWPLYSPLYRQKRTNDSLKAIIESKGFLMGWLQFTNNNGEGNLAPVGEVHWIKTGWTNSTYTNGFSNTVEVTSSRWLPPVEKGVSALEMTNATVTLSAGDLVEPFGAIYTVTTNTTLQVIQPNEPENYPNSLKAGLTARTGLLKGSFVHPGNSASTKWFGAMLQDQDYGEGFFMGLTNGGKVTLEATEEIEEIE